jgi:hypothetical protein
MNQVGDEAGATCEHGCEGLHELDCWTRTRDPLSEVAQAVGDEVDASQARDTESES